MAKHKKKRAKKVSKGIHSNVAASTIRLVREGRDPAQKIINKLNAWRAGKKGYVTVETGDPGRPFKKVTFDAYFGNGRDFKSIKNGVKVSEDKNRIEL